MVKLLESLYRGAELLDERYSLKLPSREGDGTEERLRVLLERLTDRVRGTTGASIDTVLGKELPGFPFELSYVQVMIWNCRLFGISRLRNTKWPVAPILLHDFVGRA